MPVIGGRRTVAQGESQGDPGPGELVGPDGHEEFGIAAGGTFGPALNVAARHTLVIVLHGRYTALPAMRVQCNYWHRSFPAVGHDPERSQRCRVLFAGDSPRTIPPTDRV